LGIEPTPFGNRICALWESNPRPLGIPKFPLLPSLKNNLLWSPLRKIWCYTNFRTPCIVSRDEKLNSNCSFYNFYFDILARKTSFYVFVPKSRIFVNFRRIWIWKVTFYSVRKLYPIQIFFQNILDLKYKLLHKRKLLKTF